MSDFNFVTNGNWGNYLLIESDRLKETITYIKENQVKNIEINFYHGYKLKEISFIVELSEILEGLTVIQGDIKLKGIEHLRNLKRLNLSDELNYPIDFSIFSHLEQCSVLWNKNLTSLSACKKLREMLIKKIDLTNNKSVDELKGLENVKFLTFIQSKFIDLNYLVYFPKLIELEIYYSPSLREINGLRYCQNTLEKFVLEHCKNIKDYLVLVDLKKLNYLGINEAKEIPTISFVRDIANLNHFSFVGTNVLDGDLSPCIGISYVGFDNKKHYSHTFEEISSYSLPKKHNQ